MPMHWLVPRYSTLQQPDRDRINNTE